MAAVMLVFAFTACETEDLQTTFGGGKTIRLLLNAQGDEIARAIARSEGVDAYGENTIATADVFFYDANGTLLYDVDKDNVSLSAPDANGVVTATVPMPSDDNIDLTQATVYVIGNRQATDDQVAGAKNSVADLRALPFTTDLAAVPTSGTTFVMDGTGAVTVTGDVITGHVDLVRAAAKITLTVNIPSSLTIDSKTYQAQTENITVTFNEGVKTFGVPTDVFDVEGRAGTAGTTENDVTPVTFAPFYSYPTTWKTGDANEPYLTLHVPWGETDESGVTSYKTYHYRVPINKKHFEIDGKTLALNRNHWYQITLTVGVLGTPEASDMVELTDCDYEVKPWGNLPIGAELLDYKYLVVDKNSVDIYNQNTASVAFASSHDVTLEIVSIKKWDYSTEDGVELTYAPATDATDKTVVAAESTPTNSGQNRKLLTDCTVSTTNTKKGDVVLNHELINADENTNADKDGNNNRYDDYDYVYYTITVKVTNGVYTEYITFTQYPEIYIEAERNEGGNIVNDNNTTESDDKGFVFVYNNQLNRGDDWQVVRSCLDGNNKNPNMYVINVTAMGDDTDVYIGDPRDKVSVPGSDLNIGNTINDKTLSNYYPTRTDNEKIIAPQFRMASSYGKCGSAIDHSEAKRRCAAYQEYGYPAGRWRLPTVAEFEYIQQLSDIKVIPQLYSNNSNYWTATTAYAYGSGVSNSTSGFVRCVYDEWYWGSEQIADKTVFTWGDQPR